MTIFDVGETEEQPFIVMEFLEGGSLEDRLKAGRPSTAEVIRWLDQAAAALDAGHAAGVVHRDVKPGNLLLDSHGELHVADFGVASAVGLDSLTMTGMVLGTSGYLSPEQARGERATSASDRYGLAVVAWELLSGRRPFESDNPTAEAAAHANAPIPSFSPELDPVFQRALAKDPEARYPTAAAFVDDLRSALAAPEPAPPRTTAPAGASLIPALAVLALGLLGGGLALAQIFGGDEPQQVVVTRQGQTVTVTTEAEPPPPPPSPATTRPAVDGRGGVELTDQATGLLAQRSLERGRGRRPPGRRKAQGSGELYEAYAEYDLGRALAEQGKCAEALQHLNRSEQLQGHRSEIDDARARCQ